MANGVLDSYIVKRNGTYHYRRRVPVDVQPYVGLKWWKKSLKTASDREAKERARLLAHRDDQTIAVARGAPSALRQEWLSDVAADATIELHDATAAKLPLSVQLSAGKRAAAAADAAAMLRRTMLVAAQARLASLPSTEREAVAKAGGIEALLVRTVRDADELELEHIRLLLARETGSMAVREADARHAVLQSQAPYIIKDQASLIKLGLMTEGLEEPDNPRINTALEKWLAERKQGIYAVKRHRVAIRRLVEMHGNVPVRAISKTMVRDYVKRIETLPDHRKLPSHMRGGLADPGDDVRRVAAPTVERHLASVKALLNFCISQDWLTTNVTTGLEVPKDTRPKASKRRSFTREERNKLLARAIEEGGENGDMTWLIKLVAYTGCRLEELAQLARINVREIDGVWVIEIDDLDGRNVKTTDSVKQIPLHPAIRDDFVEWVQTGKDPRVFPSFVRDRDGRFANKLSGDFARLMDRAGLTDPRLVFHSLRHTLKREMSNARLDPDVRRIVLGHAPRDAHDGYDGHSLAAVADELARLPRLFEEQEPGPELGSRNCDIE